MRLSAANRTYIACIMSWISVACRPAVSKSRRIDVKKSAIALRTPFVKGLRSMPRRVRPAFDAQRLEPDDVEQRVGLLGEHRAQRAEALHAAVEDLLVLVDARHHVSDDVLILPAQLAQIRELLGDARLPGFEDLADVVGDRVEPPIASPRRRYRASPE